MHLLFHNYGLVSHSLYFLCHDYDLQKYGLFFSYVMEMGFHSSVTLQTQTTNQQTSRHLANQI